MTINSFQNVLFYSSILLSSLLCSLLGNCICQMCLASPRIFKLCVHPSNYHLNHNLVLSITLSSKAHVPLCNHYSLPYTPQFNFRNAAYL